MFLLSFHGRLFFRASLHFIQIFLSLRASMRASWDRLSSSRRRRTSATFLKTWKRQIPRYEHLLLKVTFDVWIQIWQISLSAFEWMLSVFAILTENRKSGNGQTAIWKWIICFDGSKPHMWRKGDLKIQTNKRPLALYCGLDLIIIREIYILAFRMFTIQLRERREAVQRFWQRDAALDQAKAHCMKSHLRSQLSGAS